MRSSAALLVLIAGCEGAADESGATAETEPTNQPVAVVVETVQPEPAPSPPVRRAALPKKDLTTGTPTLYAASEHVCRLYRGEVVCWGDNTYGALGVGGQRCGDGLCVRTPSPIEKLGRVLSFSLGDEHACAIGEDKRARCWGSNEYGQLGLGARATESCVRRGGQRSEGWMDTSTLEVEATDKKVVPDEAVPCVRTPTVMSTAAAASVSASRSSSCVGAANGELRCAGAGRLSRFAELPELCGRDQDACSRTLVAVRSSEPGMSAPTNVVTLNDGACATYADGALSCVGLFLDGVRVTSASRVAPSTLHVCAIAPLGDLECRGHPAGGLLGDGGSANADDPVRSGGVVLRDAVAVASSTSHTCAVDAAGSVYCWGSNYLGQLGVGDTLDRNVPTRVSLPPVVDLAAGSGFTCAVEASGAVWCWGSDGEGQLGGAPANTRCSRQNIFNDVTDMSCALAPVRVLGPA
ncbi:MAG: hypothetical protein U0271_34310 [Polyangiaceae bacterium]